jgi:hypothetical protein
MGRHNAVHPNPFTDNGAGRCVHHKADKLQGAEGIVDCDAPSALLPPGHGRGLAIGH